METKQKEKKKENRFSFLYILGGGILKEDFIAILFLLKVIRLYYPTPQFLAWHSGSGDPERGFHCQAYEDDRACCRTDIHIYR